MLSGCTSLRSMISIPAIPSGMKCRISPFHPFRYCSPCSSHSSQLPVCSSFHSDPVFKLYHLESELVPLVPRLACQRRSYPLWIPPTHRTSSMCAGTLRFPALPLAATLPRHQSLRSRCPGGLPPPSQKAFAFFLPPLYWLYTFAPGLLIGCV